jgi:cytochrome c peroxidase
LGRRSQFSFIWRKVAYRHGHDPPTVLAWIRRRRGSFDRDASGRGKGVFEAKGKCATCHVPPLYTEPGNNLHTPAEVGVDAFQADRSPTHMYRTAPLAGLWSHQRGGFYHDGRFATLRDVIDHYNDLLQLGLTDREKANLIEYLKSL